MHASLLTPCHFQLARPAMHTIMAWNAPASNQNYSCTGLHRGMMTVTKTTYFMRRPDRCMILQGAAIRI